MYSKLQPLLLSLLVSAHVSAEQSPRQEGATPNLDFSVSPTKCVTMEQGRRCYADIVVTWKSSQPLDACLILDQQRLHCWAQQRSAQLEFEFVGSQNATLALQQGPEILARQEIQVSWVHSDTRRRSYWRLF